MTSGVTPKLSGIIIDDDDNLSEGDHIAVERSYRGVDIQHHGIVVAGRMSWKVIHFSPVEWNKEHFKWSDLKPTQPGVVYKDDLATFTTGINCLKITYPNYPTRPVDEVLQTAEQFLDKQDFGDYNFMRNNCEHFATLCKSGARVSNQTKLRVLIKSAARSLISEEKWKG